MAFYHNKMKLIQHNKDDIEKLTNIILSGEKTENTSSEIGNYIRMVIVVGLF